MKQHKLPTQQVISTTPFPNSKKVYIQGVQHDIQVAMREITLSDTKLNGKTLHKNPAVTVYDTSGVYTDENYTVDVRKGIPRIREKWIMERGDIERLYEFSSDNSFIDFLPQRLLSIRTIVSCSNSAGISSAFSDSPSGRRPTRHAASPSTLAALLPSAR